MNVDVNLKNFLLQKFEDYIKRGYIRKLSHEEVSYGGKSWFLPLFVVTNKNNNRKRIVWDAAAKVQNTALNTVLMKGPDLLRSLIGILLRFREYRIAVCGDIREMFHQIKIIKDDQKAQQFLWRNCDLSSEPDIYVMRVMTFGASCSPSLANYIKDINAERFIKDHPKAVF